MFSAFSTEKVEDGFEYQWVRFFCFVNLKQGYNGDLTSKQAGSVGGQMVKKMIKAYEESMK